MSIHTVAELGDTLEVHHHVPDFKARGEPGS
jgi:hypothetical protein